jgi:NAD(P)H-dependent flavin oxidoreductase YrpB (nitropropane dioxygenase family)
MKTALCDTIGIDHPIFGFSHCRDVVIEVSRAGGLGMLGAHRYSPEKLDITLSIIEDKLQGKPYGVNCLFPVQKQNADGAPFEMPATHLRFLDQLLDQFDLKGGHSASGEDFGVGESLIISDQRALESIAVILKHKPRLMASGLGPIPARIMQQLRERGVLTVAQVGRPEQARRQVASGIDIIVATGTEAAGHTGEIGTLVSVPQIVDAVAPVPVLAAGGIADGRQIAAALALGAEGVWMGSAWLTTVESDLHPLVKQKLLAASSADTLRTRCFTGKPSRQVRTAWTDAWEAADAPKPLPAPYQGELVNGALISAFVRQRAELMGTPAGQSIGLLHDMLSVRETFQQLLLQYAEAAERLDRINAALSSDT